MKPIYTTLFALFTASGLGAETILELSFNELNSETPPVDGTFLADESGNNFSGFYGGGAMANLRVETGPTGSGAIGVDLSTELILRPGVVDRIGQPMELSPTPSDYPIIGATTSWTIEAITRISSTNPVDNAPAILGGDGSGGEWWWRINGGDSQFLFGDGTDRVVESHSAGFDLRDDTWHHLAVVFERDAMTPTSGIVRTYVDYEEVGSTAFTDIDVVGTSTRDINVGGFVSGASSRRMIGDIDHIRISDLALSPDAFVGAAIPEPSTYVLIVGLGALALGVFRRNRR